VLALSTQDSKVGFRDSKVTAVIIDDQKPLSPKADLRTIGGDDGGKTTGLCHLFSPIAIRKPER